MKMSTGDNTRVIRSKKFDLEEENIYPKIPPRNPDDFSMDELEEIEMCMVSIPDAATIAYELDTIKARLTTLEKSLHRWRCMPCGKRTVIFILLLIIVALGINYFFDFSHAIIGYVHEKGWL